MPIRKKDMAALQPGVDALTKERSDQELSAQQADQQQGLEQLKARLQSAAQQTSLDRLKNFLLANKGILPEGSGVAISPEGASVTRGTNLTGLGAKQSDQFLKTAQGVYKPINEQLDSSKATLDYLNQGNSASDKLALINEARLAASTGGSRALGTIIPLLSGDKSMGSDIQKGLNWLQNTPNIPTMTDAQRDALRESTFSRLDQLEQQKGQADQQLLQQGAIVAPMGNAQGIVQSFANPAGQKLNQLRQMHEDYKSKRQKMQAQPPVSQPSVANPNPTTLDRLKSLFSFGGTAAPAASQSAGLPGADAIAAEMAKRAQARQAGQ